MQNDKVDFMFKDVDVGPVVELLQNHDISGWFGNNEGGDYLRLFQQCFAAYCDSAHAYTTSSGTAAIYVALRACGVGRGDSVIVPSFTHIGSVAPIVLAGAKPVFIDVDIHGTLDPKMMDMHYAKAVIAVHMLGMPCDMDEIKKRFGGFIIEDASHALGAEYKGKKAGTLGDIGCFSIGGGRTKTIACGEGGMITTNDDSLAEKCKNIRNHGDRVTDVDYPCFNFRMSELNALVGLLQMPRLQMLNKWQLDNADYFMQRLPAFLQVLKAPSYAKTVRYMISCLFDDEIAGFSRNIFLRRLVDQKWNGGVPRKNIGGAWGKLVSDIKYYHKYARERLPMSEKLRDESVWIDYHRFPRTKEEIDKLLDHIKIVSSKVET